MPLVIRSSLALIAIAVLALSFPVFANAKDTELSVSSLPREYVVDGPESFSTKLKLEIFLTTDSAQNIIVEFVDFFTDEQGNRVQLPANSTPYSLAKVLEIEEFDNFHRGEGKQQSFEVKFATKKDFPKSLFFGGVLVRLEQPSQDNSGVAAAGSILRNLTVTPYGISASLAGEGLEPAQIVRHDLRRLSRSSLIDSILPDIPGVVNFGPVESTVSYENNGLYPVFAKLGWEFMHSGKIIASKQFEATLLGPDKASSKTVTTSVNSETDTELNLLPAFGIVSNKITLTSSLGGTDLPVQTYDGSFLVIQWKEPFVALVGLYFLVRWAWRRNLSKRKKEESASLLWLAIRDLFRRRTGTRPLKWNSSAPLSNPEVKLQGSRPPRGAPNKYDIKPQRPSLADPTDLKQEPWLQPPSRF